MIVVQITLINKKFLRGGLHQWVSESVGHWVSGSAGKKVRS
jgi:hypothetical protein